LAFAPGECAQVDWGSWGTVAVGETRRRLSLFVMVLCYSRLLRIPLKSATDSGVKAATESTRSLPPIPGESCRLSERSDAGVCLVTPRRR